MKSFVDKWGLTYNQIMEMPRLQFCSLHGQRFENMTYCEFRRVIKRETPYIYKDDRIPEVNKWRPDRQVNAVEYYGCKLGGWDDGGQGELI